MTTTTTTKPDVRMLVDVYEPRGSKYLTAKVTLVYVSDGHIRNPQFWTYDPDKVGHLANLTIEAQAGKDSEDFYYSSWNAVQYTEIYHVDLPRAESMVKTLRKVNKYLEQTQDRDGYPTDFAHFVTRAAAALGVSGPEFIACRVTGFGGTYDENVYRWMNHDEFRVYLQNQLLSWKDGAA